MEKFRFRKDFETSNIPATSTQPQFKVSFKSGDEIDGVFYASSTGFSHDEHVLATTKDGVKVRIPMGQISPLERVKSVNRDEIQNKLRTAFLKKGTSEINLPLVGVLGFLVLGGIGFGIYKMIK